MAKGNKKKKSGSANMAVDVASPDHLVIDKSEAMDTSETVASGGSLRKVKGRVMKRSKNMRKVKAIARAVSQNEKSMEKISKSESKVLRTKIAKNLYD